MTASVCMYHVVFCVGYTLAVRLYSDAYTQALAVDSTDVGVEFYVAMSQAHMLESLRYLTLLPYFTTLLTVLPF